MVYFEFPMNCCLFDSSIKLLTSYFIIHEIEYQIIIVPGNKAKYTQPSNIDGSLTAIQQLGQYVYGQLNVNFKIDNLIKNMRIILQSYPDNLYMYG
ncbi:hypothetical protein HZS_502 [Henneguya salminicola]|nr:hypothetical protein HZS_502 [Henneguya salminicola]